MFRFVGTTSEGLPQKRSQSLRACEPCRRRKKRCMHTSMESNDLPATSSTPTTPTLTPTSIRQLVTDARHASPIVPNLDILSRPSIGSSSDRTGTVNDADSDNENGDRFIGDLNPESIFLAATSPQTTFSPGDDNVGIWIPRKALEGFGKRLGSNASAHSPNPDPLLSNILLPYMQRQCQQLLPQQRQYLLLHKIYVQEIHPIFPIIDLESLSTAEGSDNIATTIIVKQAICLAASTSPRAMEYLQLVNSDSTITENDAGTFANRLASAIRTSVDMGFVTDRIVIVQVLTTLALFTQFSHQSKLSAELTARAISHAQTIGLHLDVPSTRKNHDYLTRLFCCVWALDKLNAAFQGRPTMIHEHDFGRDMKKAMDMQEGCFRLLLRVVSSLDSIIALYRPTRFDSSNPAIQLPSFEDLIHESDAAKVSSAHLATVELLYHAVIVLSRRSRSSVLGSSPLELRETLSAASIAFIVGTEFREHISHMPFVPYALSLSLRVFYRELRFSSKSPFTRNRARKQLLNACTLLRESFASNFPATMKVAELAEQTVKEMEKVYNTILQQHGRSRSASEAADRHDQNTSSGGVAGGVSSDTYDARPQPGESSVMSLDLNTSEELPDLDVFDFFDADFHLDAIDAALIDNLDLTFPLSSNPADLAQEVV